MTEFLGDIGRKDDPLRSGTVLSVTNGRAKIELATGAVIPSALLVGSASAGTRVRVAYRDGQYVVYGGGAAGAGGVSISASSSGGAAVVGGTPSPHDWLGAHHTLPTGAAGLFAATPASSSGTVSMRAIALSDFQAAADARYSLASNTITAGAGLTGGGQLGSAMTINVGVGDGIAADADLVRVLRATTSGLTFSGGGLAVGAGNGISVLTSTVAVNQAFAFSWTAAHAFGAGLTATTGTFTSGLNVGTATGATSGGRIASIGSNSGTASDYIGAQFDYTQSAGGTSITAYAYRATARATHTSGVLSGLQSNSTVAEFAGAGGTTTNGEVLTSYAVVSSGATVGTLNMIKVFAPAVSGTVSTLVGLRISSMTGASSNWSIYTEGGAHYFTGDTTQVGTLSVNAGLNVGGATGATPGQIRASAGISGTTGTFTSTVSGTSGTFTGGINVGSATGAAAGEVRTTSAANPRVVIESTGSAGNSRSFLRFSGAVAGEFISIGYYPDASPRRMHINYNSESASLPIMSLTSANRVGINMQTPSYALDVSGDIRANGGLNVGSATGADTGDVKFSGSIVGTGAEGLRTTWTPTFEWSGGGTGTFTYATQSAVYTKIANVVYIAARITLSGFTIGTSTGNLRISNLPFTVANLTPLPVVSVAGCSNWTTVTPDRGIFFNNTTYLLLYSGPLTTQTIGTANVSATSSIYVSGFYYTT